MKENNINDIFISIENCLAKGLIHPALLQIYTIIDIFSWMAFGDLKVRVRFTKWLDLFVTLENINSIDLYAARCGVLHTMTPESDLSKNKNANQIYYAWGNCNKKKLKKTIELTSTNDIEVVHLNELFDAVKIGYQNFLNSDNYQDYLKTRAMKQFGHIKHKLIDDFLEYMETDEPKI